MTWQVLARVDGTTYALFGVPDPSSGVTSATTLSASYTSTHTYFNLAAGKVSFSLDFFNPITPNDLVDHSLPFSFLTVNSTSASAAQIEIFTAIDGTWLAGDAYKAGSTARSGPTYDLTHSASSGLTYLSFTNHSSTPFAQSKQQATWGSISLAASGSSTQVSAANGVPAQLLQSFIKTGSAGHSVSTTLQQGHLIGLSYNMGKVQSEGATFAIGNFRSQSILFRAAETTALSAYFMTVYPTLDSALEYFASQYQKFQTASLALDSRIRLAAAVVSTNLADMVEASVRQSYGTTEVVYDEHNPQQPMAFLKEISSNGDANSLDVIRPTMPIYLFLSPQWIKYHMQPYINYIQSGKWQNDFIPHDNGVYPHATGPGPENMPLQNTATWMHMLWAYNKATNGTDMAWIQAQKSFLEPMVAHMQDIANATTMQLGTVDWAGAHRNQTGLAIQGAQGLQIYGKLFGEPSYIEAGATLAKQLYEDGLGMDDERTHFTYMYGNDESWNVHGASIFVDKSLGLKTMPDSAWQLEEEWYGKKTTKLGLPYIGGFATKGDQCNPHGGNLVITEWTMWAIAGVSNTTLRNELIDGSYAFFTNKLNNVPFPTRYCTVGANAGLFQLCRARSTVGSLFAPLIPYD